MNYTSPNNFHCAHFKDVSKQAFFTTFSIHIGLITIKLQFYFNLFQNKMQKIDFIPHTYVKITLSKHLQINYIHIFKLLESSPYLKLKIPATEITVSGNVYKTYFNHANSVYTCNTITHTIFFVLSAGSSVRDMKKHSKTR